MFKGETDQYFDSGSLNLQSKCEDTPISDDPEPNEYSDQDPNYIEESQSEEETESLARSPSNAALSRTEFRRATLVYQELPPRQHRRKKQSLLVIKTNPERMRELIGPQSSMSSTQPSVAETSVERLSTGSFSNRSASPFRSSLPSPASSADETTRAFGVNDASPGARKTAARLTRDFFLGIETPEQAMTAEREIDHSGPSKYSLTWYSATERFQTDSSKNPKWSEMCNGLGICEDPCLSLEIQYVINDLFHKDPDMLGNLHHKSVQELHESSVEKMDESLQTQVLKLRPYCSTEYRKWCWRKILAGARALAPDLPSRIDDATSLPPHRQMETRRLSSASVEHTAAAPGGLQTPSSPSVGIACIVDRQSPASDRAPTFSRPLISRVRNRHRPPVGQLVRESDLALAKVKRDDNIGLANEGNTNESSYYEEVKFNKGSSTSFEASPSLSQAFWNDDDAVRNRSAVTSASLSPSASLRKRPANEQTPTEDQFDKRVKKLRSDDITCFQSRSPSNSSLSSYNGERVNLHSASGHSVPKFEEMHTIRPPERPSSVLNDGPQCASASQSIESDNSLVHGIAPVEQTKRKSKKRKASHGPLQFGFCPDEDDQYIELHKGVVGENTMEAILSKLQDQFEDKLVGMQVSVYQPAKQGIEVKDLQFPKTVIRENDIEGSYKELRLFLTQAAFRPRFLEGMQFLVEEIPIESFWGS